MIKKNIIMILSLFLFCSPMFSMNQLMVQQDKNIMSSSYFSCDDNKLCDLFDLEGGSKKIFTIIYATKYISLLLCILFGIKGAKKGIKAAKLLLPMGLDLQVADLIKFPFRLACQFPCKAYDSFFHFMLFGAFASYMLFLHKLGV